MNVSTLQSAMRRVVDRSEHSSEHMVHRNNLMVLDSEVVEQRDAVLFTIVASKNAYSNSALPSISCFRKNAAFLTSLNKDTWTLVYGRCGSRITDPDAILLMVG